MKICIIGSGYVGLVTGACFAQTGNTVYCVDNDKEKVGRLQKGMIPIYEPGLEEYVVQNAEKGRLIFTSDLAEGINNADISFIAVGTPQDEDGSADLRYVRQVCEDICAVAKKKVIIATKSTVPVGTGDELEEIFSKKLNQPYVVFSNPEFLKEGDAINDFMKPDRIVVGTNDESIIPMLKDLYAPFTHQKNRIIFMQRRSAEITKYAANCMLALRISFMNEMANFCDKVGADVNDVRIGIGSDPRIGSAFLYPGLGYGGSCFPKDVKAMTRVAHEQDMPLKTIEACDDVNQAQVGRFFKKVTQAFQGLENLHGKKIAVWGLAFKARTDDIRESQALKLIDHLLEAGADVHVSDPEAMDNTKLTYLDKLTYHDNCTACLDDAEALIVATDWNEYKSPDFIDMKKRMKRALILDGRNLYTPKRVREHGFDYFGVGVR
ncbi:MAG: UDP-glucose/GDP-mannose dehydrogenase family protein [bacterium]|nr:UDP-glucose/GDP-mannose dehydrogenase family protein [bacterium]MBU1919095.1 UDP-glucose/GDP-mannose dehydrogenase family protein [bacterium]